CGLSHCSVASLNYVHFLFTLKSCSLIYTLSLHDALPISVKKEKKKTNRKGTALDWRLAENTIKESIKLASENGIELKTSEEDHGEFHRIIIDIPVKSKKK